MNPNATFKGVSAMLMPLTDDELRALVDSPESVRRLAAALVAKKDRGTFFRHISDKYIPENFSDLVVPWRRLASDLGYTGPVVWDVRAGFTLKTHAPKAGPCYDRFSYMKDCSFQNDEPTKKATAFFVPRLLTGSTNKNVSEQIALMSNVRQTYALPAHHLASFGSAAMLTGLVLAHFKRTGERTPLNSLWARTDTLRADGRRLDVGDFDDSGLYCSGWDGGDRYGFLGVFPLGVELGL